MEYQRCVLTRTLTGIRSRRRILCFRPEWSACGEDPRSCCYYCSCLVDDNQQDSTLKTDTGPGHSGTKVYRLRIIKITPIQSCTVLFIPVYITAGIFVFICFLLCFSALSFSLNSALFCVHLSHLIIKFDLIWFEYTHEDHVIYSFIIIIIILFSKQVIWVSQYK